MLQSNESEGGSQTCMQRGIMFSGVLRKSGIASKKNVYMCEVTSR